MMASTAQAKIEPDQDSLRVRQVADDFAHRLGEFAHQRRHGDDLVALGQLRRLQQINHRDVVLAGQVLLAQLLEVGKGFDGSRGWARDIQSEIPFGFRAARGRPVLAAS